MVVRLQEQLLRKLGAVTVPSGLKVSNIFTPVPLYQSVCASCLLVLPITPANTLILTVKQPWMTASLYHLGV